MFVPPVNSALADGFLFALSLIESLGLKYDLADIAEQLRLVATGELSLIGTPAEELADAERRRGSPMTAADAQLYQLVLQQHRRSADCENAAMAVVIAQMLFSANHTGQQKAQSQ